MPVHLGDTDRGQHPETRCPLGHQDLEQLLVEDEEVAE